MSSSNKKAKLKFLLIGLKRPVLDVLFCWLDNNYGKKNMLAKQNSQDKKRFQPSSKEQKTVSTKELAERNNKTEISRFYKHGYEKKAN